jgi:hypothetical protein
MSRYDQIPNVLEVPLSQSYHDPIFIDRALAALAQSQTRANVKAAVTAAALAALTNSTGGTPGSTVAALVTPTPVVADGTTLYTPKAGFDTAIAAIRDAHQEIVARTNVLIGYIAGSLYTTVRALTGATAADGTIGAISSALTGSATAAVPAADAIAQIVALRNTEASLTAAVNFVRVSLGMATLPDNSGGVFDVTNAHWATYDSATTGTGVGAAHENVLALTDVNTLLGVIKNNIATLAKYLNDAIAITAAGPIVVAVAARRLVPQFANGITG